MPKLLFLNGPNLNLLGKREPEIYGNFSLTELDGTLTSKISKMNCEVSWYQSNAEAELVNKIHASARLIPALSRPPTILQFESDIPDAPKTFALAMPDEYKEENVYSSYRNYLINEKSHFAKWERDPSRKPTWWIN